MSNNGMFGPQSPQITSPQRKILDRKIDTANISAIRMLSEEKDPWSKRRDLKKLLPSPGGEEERKR